MNKAWSEQNHLMQTQLKKRESFPDGIRTLLALRQELMQVLLSFREHLTDTEFTVNPFVSAGGTHSATAAYSIWHIFRIEDIVVHTLICGDEQVFFSGDYKARMHAPIITTGNELSKMQMTEFSAELNLDALYQYIGEVKESTEDMLKNLSYDMLKQKIPAARREQLLALRVVSDDESAAWLTDYWCGKNILGLIQMPLSRHWIMHIEACLRIVKKLHPTLPF